MPSGFFKVVVHRNTRLPFSKSFRVTSSQDNQQELRLVIHQGDQDTAADNEFLGSALITGLPAGPKGSVELMVTFDVSTESNLTVTARDNKSGRELKVDFAARRVTGATTGEDTSPKLQAAPAQGVPQAAPTAPPSRPSNSTPGPTKRAVTKPNKPYTSTLRAPEPPKSLWERLLAVFNKQ